MKNYEANYFDSNLFFSTFVKMNIEAFYRYKSGIYCISNTINSDCYIGSSKDVYNRLHTHKCLLKNNKHKNKHLQSAFNKYKIQNFNLKLIEECSLECLLEREQYYIDTLKPKYNKNNKVTEVYIHKWTDEERIQASEKQKAVYQNQKINPSWKKIFVYDLNGNFIKMYEGITLFAKEVNAVPRSISRALKYWTGVYKQFQLRYENDSRPISKYKRTNTRKGKIQKTSNEKKKIIKFYLETKCRLKTSDAFKVKLSWLNKFLKNNNINIIDKICGRKDNIKVNNTEFEKIKEMYSKGMSQKKIAQIYNVNQSVISRIINNNQRHKSQKGG